MEPPVEAALVAAVATAVVAVVGTVPTSLTTSRTLRASRESAGEARLWAKTAEVYETLPAQTAFRKEIVEAVLHQQRQGAELQRRSAEPLPSRLDGYQQPERFEFEAKVRAYAFDSVLLRFTAAGEAEEKFLRADGNWTAYYNLDKDSPGGPWVAHLPHSQERLQQAHAAVDQALTELADQVRRELREGHLRPQRRRWLRPNRDPRR
ncbi:hypothetical protein [Kitasatospora sp. NPDC089509]|uniref:hypothetical protein n=1 Tax=Kitasatospora sp. NPDC089509 TaxID=3364079 RepID=UPI003811726E